MSGETWHARVVDKAAWQAGFRVSKLIIDLERADKIDLRDVLKEGTYAVEGIQNKVWYRGKTKVDLWGKDVLGPDKVPSEWRHVVCVKDGKVLDWEHDDNGTRHADGGAKPLSVLWLRAGNTVDVTKGYFRSILKVYTITPRSPAAGFKRSCEAATLAPRTEAMVEAAVASERADERLHYLVLEHARAVEDLAECTDDSLNLSTLLSTSRCAPPLAGAAYFRDTLNHRLVVAKPPEGVDFDDLNSSHRSLEIPIHILDNQAYDAEFLYDEKIQKLTMEGGSYVRIDSTKVAEMCVNSTMRRVQWLQAARLKLLHSAVATCKASLDRHLEACAASAAPTENACPNSPSKKARADVAPLATKA